MRALLLAAAFVLAPVALAPVAAFAQSLTVVAADGHETVLTSEALAALPRAAANLRQGGKSTAYEGPTLSAVLRAAGAPVGVKLHGKPLVAYVVVTGSDGYRAILSVAESDPWFSDTPVILADRKADGPLADDEGDFRLVVAGDKRPERAVRMVVKVEVKAAP
ncbi:MAG: molybdopterin-dependent oxidoreductase [Caulobacter sp.]|nr:molybdopterin-dependent oxidoreductase [Caulobacter sp.]